MRRSPSSTESGVALLQVLLLSMIVTLLVLQLIYSARGQLRLANDVEHRVEADLLIHSAFNRALFSLITDPGSFTRQREIPLDQMYADSTFASEPFKNAQVQASLRDISGLLPQRSPEHPLWRPVLLSLGMTSQEASVFLQELGDMQDADLQDFRQESEPLFSRSGFRYPNVPIQIDNSLSAWSRMDPELMASVLELSHHYPRSIVNLRHSPPLIQASATDAYGTRLIAQQGDNQSERSVSDFLEERFGYWVTTDQSNFWRLDISVQSDDIVRDASFDFYIDSQSNPPFLLVGQ